MIKELKQEIKELRRYMKDNGIKKMSFMNRCPDLQTSRCNARRFYLETKIKELESIK